MLPCKLCKTCCAFAIAILWQEITAQRVELEQRVAKRTLELAESNAALTEANRRLRQLASVDHLTGIANRRHFHDTGTRELERQAADNRPACLLMFDLDHFKRINDRYGHDVGDTVLRCVVDEVQQVLRPMDLFGRYGGEEFLILLPDTDTRDALAIAERIRKRVETLRTPHGENIIQITTSLGVAQWDGKTSLDKLIAFADHILYKAKAGGRNCVRASSIKRPSVPYADMYQ